MRYTSGYAGEYHSIINGVSLGKRDRNEERCQDILWNLLPSAVNGADVDMQKPRLAECSDLGGKRLAFPVTHAAEICEASSNS